MIWEGRISKKIPPSPQNVARRKLRMLNNAQTLADLRVPPANRLEALRGSQKGTYSIRLNDHWRLCFCWQEGDVKDIEIVDYH